MKRKALTAAIAGALAAPMAAQAVDFTISGHVNRALFVVDKDLVGKDDDGTKANVSDNTSSGTRIRFNGGTELDNGNKVSIQFEYGASDTLSLRHANVQYGGPFGKVTLGKGSEAGDGSQYSDKTGVFGIAHGQHGGTRSLGSYFGSLDGGGRTEMVRYDTPSLGPVSAAVSVANGDRVSGLLKLDTEFSGTSFGAQLATLRMPAEKDLAGKEIDESTVGASFGAKMANGLTVSGAWAKGKDMTSADGSLGTPGTPAMPERTAVADDVRYDQVCAPDVVNQVATNIIYNTGTIPLDGSGDPDPAAGTCYVFGGPNAVRVGDTIDAVDAVPGTPGVPTTTDPSYFQAQVGYVFGNSAVAVSWYKSQDFVREGSEGTAIGIGAKHTLPKAAAELYTAVQRYSVKRLEDAEKETETVFVVGSRIKF